MEHVIVEADYPLLILVCTICDNTVCHIEDGDTLDVLVSTANDHLTTHGTAA
jgi:hypothetical protein